MEACGMVGGIAMLLLLLGVTGTWNLILSRQSRMNHDEACASVILPRLPRSVIHPPTKQARSIDAEPLFFLLDRHHQPTTKEKKENQEASIFFLFAGIIRH